MLFESSHIEILHANVRFSQPCCHPTIICRISTELHKYKEVHAKINEKKNKISKSTRRSVPLMRASGKLVKQTIEESAELEYSIMMFQVKRCNEKR